MVRSRDADGTSQDLPRFDEILEWNRRLAVDGRAQLGRAPESIPLILVTCFEPALDQLLAALGLEAGEAVWFRTAGGCVPRGSSTLRDLIVAVILMDVREILVVGHSLCRMATFDTSGFIDAFRERGVSREAFGTDDLREWVGAVPNVRRGLELAIENIVASPACPRGLSVHGAILDEGTARLSPVLSASPATEAEATPEPLEAREAPQTTLPAGSPAATGERTLRDFLRQSSRYGYEVKRLKAELSRQTSPFAKLRLITGFVKRVGAESREVIDSFERLKQEIGTSKDSAADVKELVRRLEQILEGP